MATGTAPEAVRADTVRELRRIRSHTSFGTVGSRRSQRPDFLAPAVVAGFGAVLFWDSLLAFVGSIALVLCLGFFWQIAGNLVLASARSVELNEALVRELTRRSKARGATVR